MKFIALTLADGRLLKILPHSIVAYEQREKEGTTIYSSSYTWNIKESVDELEKLIQGLVPTVEYNEGYMDHLSPPIVYDTVGHLEPSLPYIPKFNEKDK